MINSKSNTRNVNQEVLERLKKVKQLKTDADVAKFLNIKPNTLSNWKKRNSYDLEKIIAKSAENNIDLNWLLTGRGEILKNETSEKPSLKSLQCKIELLKQNLQDKERIIKMQDDRIKDLENKQNTSS